MSKFLFAPDFTFREYPMRCVKSLPAGAHFVAECGDHAKPWSSFSRMFPRSPTKKYVLFSAIFSRVVHERFEISRVEQKFRCLERFGLIRSLKTQVPQRLYHHLGITQWTDCRSNSCFTVFERCTHANNLFLMNKRLYTARPKGRGFAKTHFQCL